VGERLRVGEVVDGDEVDVAPPRLLGGAEDVAADAAEPVDGDADGQVCSRGVEMEKAGGTLPSARA
jgi:hypothetical protein